MDVMQDIAKTRQTGTRLNTPYGGCRDVYRKRQIWRKDYTGEPERLFVFFDY
jgi:hypothetical protein